MNLNSILEANAKTFAKSPALIDGADDSVITYQDLFNKVDTVAYGLTSIGVQKGDRVALYLPNCSEYIIAYFAILRLGAIAVPFNILFKSEEIQYILNDSGAKVIIGAVREISENLIPHRQMFPVLQTLIGIGPKSGNTMDIWFVDWLNSREHVKTTTVEDNQPASILYTSGTTGKPKGAVLSHHSLAYNAMINAHYLLGINDQDVSLGLSPYCHVFFVQIILGPLYVGASIIILPRSSPDLAMAAIEKYRVTHFSGVPTLYRYMFQRYKEGNYDLSSWRIAGSAAASITKKMVVEIEATFGVDFFEAYGSTEISSTATNTRLRHPRPGSIGLPAPGYQVELFDEKDRAVVVGDVGELVVKGPGIFLSYWGKPEATKEAFTSEGWYKTGDLARQDEEGYFYIVDRKKDMIVSGGYNVYPREVEEILLNHPDIAEVAVVGKSDVNLGEVPIGYVILRPDVGLTQESIIDFCRERMAKYKIPRVIEIVEDFPRTTSGKILKRMIL